MRLTKLPLAIKKFIEGQAFVWLCAGWLAIQSVYIAITTKFAVPPDERYHTLFIKLYQHNGLSPFIARQDISYSALGDAIRTPSYFYHYLFGLISHINDSLLFLRLVNVALGIAIVVVAYKLFLEIGISKAAAAVALFLLVNTEMFVFLVASVNYDNLLNLLALLSMLFLTKFIKRKRVIDAVLVFIFMAAAVLTKFSFIPLVPVFLAAIMVVGIRNWSKIKRDMAHNSSWLFPLFILLALLAGLIGERYAINLTRYHQIAPACEKLHSSEFCLGSKPVEVPKTAPAYNIFSYLPQWLLRMERRTFGIFGHKTAPQSIVMEWFFPWLAAAFVFAISMKLKPSKNRLLAFFLVSSLIYAVVLFLGNFAQYRHTGLVSIAIQGRYLFIFLPIFFAIGIECLLRLTRDRLFLKTGLVSVILLVFALSSLPNYLFTTSVDMRNGRLDGTYKAFQSHSCLVRSIYRVCR